MRLQLALSCWLVVRAIPVVGVCLGDQPGNCCVPLDASGEHELARAITEQVNHHAHLEHEEAALARKLEKDAESKHHKEEDAELLRAEKQNTKAKEAEVDAEHELREEEEKAKHEEAETIVAAKVEETEKQVELNAEKKNLEKLIDQEERLAQDLGKLEGKTPEENELKSEVALAEAEAKEAEEAGSDADENKGGNETAELGEAKTKSGSSTSEDKPKTQTPSTDESPEEEEEDVLSGGEGGENGLFLNLPRARGMRSRQQARPLQNLRHSVGCGGSSSS